MQNYSKQRKQSKEREATGEEEHDGKAIESTSDKNNNKQNKKEKKKEIMLKAPVHGEQHIQNEQIEQK